MVVSKSTPINRRAAQENAAIQNRERITNLVEKGKAAAIQSDKSGNTVAGDSFANQANYFADMAKKKVQNNYATPTNDLDLGFNPSNLTVQNGQLTTNNEIMGLDGKLNASAISRLRATGMSDADIKKRINGLKPSIQETMSNTPNENPTTAASYISKSGGTLPFGGSIKTEQMGENGNREYILDNGTRVSAAAYDAELQKSYNTTKDQNATNANYRKSNVAETIPETTKPTTPEPRKDYTPEISNLVDSVYGADNPMGAMLKMQAAQALADKQIALEQAATDKNSAITAAQTDGEAYQTILDTIQSKYESNKSEYDKMLTDKADSEQKFLLAQQERDQNYLEFQKSEAIRQSEQEKSKAVLQLSISQALGGKAFSGASNEQIASTERAFTDSIKSLAKSYDFKISDSVAAYTQKYQDVNTQFRFDLKAASDSLDQKISAYSVDSFSNKQAISQAKTSAQSAFAKEVKSITSGYTSTVDKMVNSISEDRYKDIENNLQAEKYGMDLLNDSIKNYGTNIPESLKKKIQGLVPTLNVNDLIASNKANIPKKTSGSGIVGFGIHERSPTGKAPSKEDFLKSKFAEFNKNNISPMNKGVMPDYSSWEAEWKAKMAKENESSGLAILEELQIKSAMSGVFGSVDQAKSTENSIKQAISAGNVKLARDIVDNVGLKVPAKWVDRKTVLDDLEIDITKMQNLMDRVEDKVGAFPTKGALWGFLSENVESDPDYQELIQLRDSTITKYARGVGLETGAGSDRDASRALSSVINPNVDATAMRAQLQSAKQKVLDARMTHLENGRRAGWKVNDFINEQPLDPTLTKEQQQFLNSF